MTPKRALFAENYALDHNGAAAAVRAGYAKRSARQIASELLAKPDVQERVAQFEENASARLNLTRDKVIEGLSDALELARRQGNPVAMVSALREIGKLIGAYAEERTKIEISIEGASLQAKFAGMSDAELLSIADVSELSS